MGSRKRGEGGEDKDEGGGGKREYSGVGVTGRVGITSDLLKIVWA